MWLGMYNLNTTTFLISIIIRHKVFILVLQEIFKIRQQIGGGGGVENKQEEEGRVYKTLTILREITKLRQSTYQLIITNNAILWVNHKTWYMYNGT